jgi:hypothetical protein
MFVHGTHVIEGDSMQIAKSAAWSGTATETAAEILADLWGESSDPAAIALRRMQKKKSTTKAKTDLELLRKLGIVEVSYRGVSLSLEGAA